MRNENEKSFAGEVKVDKESGQTLNNLYRPLVEGVECVSTLLYHDIEKMHGICLYCMALRGL